MKSPLASAYLPMPSWVTTLSTDARASPAFTWPASATVFRHEHRAPPFHYLILMGVSGREVYGQKPPSASNGILGKPGSEQDCIFFADDPGERQLLSGVDGARRQVDLLKDNSQRVGAQGCGRHYVQIPEHSVGLLHGLDVEVYFLRLKPACNRRKLVADGEFSYIWHVVFQGMVLLCSG